MSVRAAISPRLLTRQQAATYCGVSISVFNTACPVPVVMLGQDRRLERYDVRLLDDWIDRLKADTLIPTQEDYLARLG